MTSIRARLSVFLLLAAVLTAAVIGLITYRHTLKENEDLFDYQLRQIALSLRDQGVIAEPSDGFDEEGQDLVVQIWTNNGAMLYLSRPGDPLMARATLGFTDVVAGNRRWRVYSMAARDRIIQVAQPLELRRDLAAAAALRGLAPLLAFAPLMAILIWWSVGSSLSPLKRLANEIAQRDARSLEQVAANDLPSEIAPLVSALNALLARLRQAFSRQRAFVADAAHELRSPLSALKLQLNLLESAADDVARAEALRMLNLGVDRATHLIEQLLIATRTDPNDMPVPHQTVNLAELVRQTIAELFVFAQERGLRIELDAPEHVPIQADPDGLHILARNLLDNAIRYSPTGGALLVTIASRENKALFAIEDAGPGIAASNRKRVFDRFFRVQGNQQPGSGLGLSIVKNIVEQHQAAIELGTSRYGGLKVTILFSLSAPASGRAGLSLA